MEDQYEQWLWLIHEADVIPLYHGNTPNYNLKLKCMGELDNSPLDH